MKNQKVKRFDNYITWKDNKGNFNTQCNRASLEQDLCLTIPTTETPKVLTGGGSMTEKEILDRINNGEKLEIEIKEIVPTPTNENSELRIRKLTPKECIKLMGFETQDYEKLKKCGLSDSAIYHIAGDSIITTCIVALFSEMCNVDQTEIIETYTKGLIEK